MIDTHCHIDLHDRPLDAISKFTSRQMECVSVTMLPSHYKLSLPHLEAYDNIHASLGLHPLRAREGKRELAQFIQLAKAAEYIGEIGLDFSRDGKSTRALQEEMFAEVLPSLKGGKFVSVHSRESAKKLLEMLSEARVAPVCFHYFTGAPSLAQEVIQAGHYMSFNLRMLTGRHKSLLSQVPAERVLIESDAPFLTESPHLAVANAYSTVAKHWGITLPEAEGLISRNFLRCRTARDITC
ncbi:TatD family hydrolase [Haloferula sp. BvORR071]|uniref:TatD family hydrolase n=1 Tax=Haloferula sp. BvORR071 TaxID=1396141 RepID=UPI000698924D|nr:TatD family hydrolase [Haloferula sp. BvORR071]